MKNKKYTFEYVKQYFGDQGCELLEIEYINCKTKMRYRCSCGNISDICFDNFKQGKRCAKCAGNNKYTLEYVKQYFEDQGCELLEKEYKNNKALMRYRCSCGNISRICFGNFKIGKRCVKCCGSEKHTFKYVYKYFKEQGCELLETEYINNLTPMKYKCSCGNISKICFGSFQQGSRCAKCGLVKISGKNNYNYNPNLTDKERDIGRIYPENIQWRNDIYKNDNWICQICDKRGGNLNAHHKDGWKKFPEKRFIEDNGATLCSVCHHIYHKFYGVKDIIRDKYEYHKWFRRGIHHGFKAEDFEEVLKKILT